MSNGLEINIQPLTKPMGFIQRPITINEDNSITVGINMGSIEEVQTDDGTGKLVPNKTFVKTGQASYYTLPTAQGQQVLNTIPEKGETVGQAQDRVIGKLLRDNGALTL